LGTILRVAYPIEKTIPEAIKDALETAGLTNLDDSFDTLSEIEENADRKVWLNVRSEHEISLATHIDTLTTLGNYYLVIRNDGNMGLIQGLKFDPQNQPGLEITASEITPPYNIYTKDDDLLIGYSVIYIDGVNVDLLEKTVGAATIQQYKAKKRWKPIQPQSTNVQDYNYLYNNLATAEHYGDLMLNEFSAPRWVIRSACKGSISGLPASRFEFELGARFALTLNLGTNGRVNQEPVAVYSYNKDELRNQYSELELIFTNKPEGVSRTEIEINRPVIISYTTAAKSITLIVADFGDNQQFATVFEYNGYKVYDTEIYSIALANVTDLGDGTYTYTYSDAGLTSGQTYYIQLYEQNSGFKSKKTRILQFQA
jgi:hypothetical protein